MQTVELCLDHPFLFCPVTGMPIVDDEDVYSSPALAFIYLTEIEDFQYVHPELEKIYQQCEEEANDQDEESEVYAFDLFLEKIKDLENHVMFTITTSGMACGPVSSTIHYCFDMNYMHEEEEG